MKKINVLFLCLLCLLLVGCNEKKTQKQNTKDTEETSKTEENTDNDLVLLQQQIDDLTTRLTILEEENKSLTIEIQTLKDADTTIKTTQTNNYNELKKLANSTVSPSQTNNYTITEKELKGTWTYTYVENGKQGGKKETRTVNLNDAYVVGNMICTKTGDGFFYPNCLPYQYINKKLYMDMSFGAAEMTKQ